MIFLYSFVWNMKTMFYCIFFYIISFFFFDKLVFINLLGIPNFFSCYRKKWLQFLFNLFFFWVIGFYEYKRVNDIKCHVLLFLFITYSQLFSIIFFIYFSLKIRWISFVIFFLTDRFWFLTFIFFLPVFFFTMHLFLKHFFNFFFLLDHFYFEIYGEQKTP